MIFFLEASREGRVSQPPNLQSMLKPIVTIKANPLASLALSISSDLNAEGDSLDRNERTYGFQERPPLFFTAPCYSLPRSQLPSP